MTPLPGTYYRIHTKNMGSENTIHFVVVKIISNMPHRAHHENDNNYYTSLQILSRFKLVSNTVSSCGRRESKTFSPSAVALIPLYLYTKSDNTIIINVSRKNIP